MIVDAGGGTVDISSYSRNQKESFEEIASPQRSFIFIILNIAKISPRSLPRLDFCDYPRKNVFRGYVVAKIDPLYH